MDKCSALDIANYIVYLMSDACDDLSNMKLNKMLYYAQGHCLKRTGHTMFDDEIEAWQHGPIIESVYQKYKTNGERNITDYDMSLINNVSELDRDILFAVARKYGRYTASALRNMTHVPKSPWDVVYDGGRHCVIPVDLIKDYFNDHEEELHPLEIQFSEEDIIDKRDENNVILLPDEWDD